MRSGILVASIVVAACGAAETKREPARSQPATTNFDAEAIATTPAGFASLRTGSGAVGRWQIQRADDAPSGPHVVAQVDSDPTSVRYPMLVADSPTLRDGRASVRCKAVSGGVDQACGLAVRVVDENTYYVTRSNVLEDNIRLYHVVNGKRTEIASYSGEVAQGWHELSIEARGDQLRVSWDGKPVIEHRDSTIDKPGRVALWTKADSVTQFDDLVIESFDPGSSP